MQLLYKAYSCEDVQGVGQGKVLLPGYAAHLDFDVRCGDVLHVEFADGTWLAARVIGIEQVDLDEAMARRFRAPDAGCHRVLRVSGELNYPLLAQGALVYLDMTKAGRFNQPRGG